MDLLDALLCMKYLCTVVLEMVHEFFVRDEIHFVQLDFPCVGDLQELE